MLDEHGNTVDEATPARPVQVLGLTSVPGAGDSFLVVGEDRVARQIAQTRQARPLRVLYAGVPCLCYAAGLLLARRFPIDESVQRRVREAVSRREAGLPWQDPLAAGERS